MVAKKAKKTATAGPRLVDDTSNGEAAPQGKRPRAGAYWHPMANARNELGTDATQGQVAAKATELLKGKGGDYVYTVEDVAKFEDPNKKAAKKPASSTGKKRGRPRKVAETSDSGSYTFTEIQAVKKLLQDLGSEKAKALINLLA